MTLKRAIPGILVVLAVNTIVLIEVARNRAEPLQTIRLTERELPLERAQTQDNSGIFLKLNWNPGAGFDRAKLHELGFDCAPIGEGKDNVPRRPLPKLVFAALEYEYKERPPIPDRVTGLTLVDAARTAAELRAKYPDTTRYLIVQAMVRVSVRVIPNLRGSHLSSNPPDWWGEAVEILPSEVYVPLPLASELDRTCYSVTLCYGRHFEPWISAISPTASTR